MGDDSAGGGLEPASGEDRVTNEFKARPGPLNKVLMVAAHTNFAFSGYRTNRISLLRYTGSGRERA